MNIKQLYTGCLAHAAYYIESKGEAAIFDPLREVEPYLKYAEQDGAEIKYIFETHFHADFVSGHLDLQKMTGAQIVFGPTAEPAYSALIAKDNQVFRLGEYSIKVIHTPGHTMESTCYLLIDENGEEHGIITGDTLFIGDVGRPDLAQHLLSELTEKKLAGLLYDSLRNKIMPLADHLIVYPNHGAGSACGKMMSPETTDTLGHQKKVNYALQPELSKKAFIREVLSGLTPPPGYFPKNALMNKQGYESIETVRRRGKTPLSPEAFEAIANTSEALLLDTRNATDFAFGFIPNSINIGLEGSFAPWVGEMIPDIRQEILLITYPGKEEETLTRLARVGYDNCIGFLAGGIDSWKKEGKQLETINRISSERFQNIYLSNPPLIFDLRKKSEYDTGHVPDAINIPLNLINDHLEKFPRDEEFLLYCAGGYRSMIAASILKQRGWENFSDVIGGLAEIAETRVPVSIEEMGMKTA